MGALPNDQLNSLFEWRISIFSNIDVVRAFAIISAKLFVECTSLISIFLFVVSHECRRILVTHVVRAFVTIHAALSLNITIGTSTLKNNFQALWI